jgi:hypothetical protein
MVRTFPAAILAAFGLAGALAGCAPGPMIDRLPADMGLPAAAPARPATPYQYPAVHDMPPARATPTMSEEEQLKLEGDLAATRDRQEGREAPAKKAAPPALKNKAATVAIVPPAGAKTAAPASKKKPADVIVVPPAGVKANP